MVSVFANVCPNVMAQITSLWFAGKLDESRALFFEWLDMMNALFYDVNPIPVKAAMQKLGHPCGGCRLPLTDMPESSLNMMLDVLRKHKLIS